MNVTVREEQEAAFLPNPSSEQSSNGLDQSNSEVVLQPLVVPRYPCFSFCNDSQVQECKNELVLALNVSLGGSPILDYYLGNITDWFNCTRLNAKSAYSRDEKREVCLARPGALGRRALRPHHYLLQQHPLINYQRQLGRMISAFP